jgi:hypothetical protein
VSSLTTSKTKTTKLKNNKKMSNIQLFENQQVRTVWDAENEKWYVSIIDVIAILTESPNPQVYWRVMKKRLKDEGNETVTNCNGLKMVSSYSHSPGASNYM